MRLPPTAHPPPSSTIKTNLQGTAMSVESCSWQSACGKLSAWRETCFQEISLSPALIAASRRDSRGRKILPTSRWQERNGSVGGERKEEGERGFERLGPIPLPWFVQAETIHLRPKL